MTTALAPQGTDARQAGRTARAGAAVVSVLALGHLALGAFAAPRSHFVLAGSIPVATDAGWVLRLVVAAGAAVCFVLGPGLIWRRIRPRGLLDNLAFLWIPGALYLFAVGGVAWWVAHWIDPSLTCALLLLPVPIGVLWCARDRSGQLLGTGEGTAILLFLLVFAIGLGVSVWSLGPEGELYGGTISRTLEAGPRSDSRISYNVIAMLAHGDSPYGPQGTFLYAPYNFYARGPVAGLAAGAVVMAGGAAPQRAYPDAPWEPFDREGFMTYRIVMMLLNATAILSVFGLAASFLRRRLAVAVAALVALSPFVVYEVYFTWPKLLAASYVVAAAVALLRRRRVLAGVLLGLAYLAHPSALFAAPGVLLAWLVLRERGAGALPVEGGDHPETCAAAPGFGRWCIDSLVVVVSLGVVYLGWRVLNAGHTIDYFNDYLGSAYGKVDASTGDWIRSRLHLTANSFIPFRQVFADPHDEFTNLVGGQSPFIVRVATAWRSTFTVAVGLLYLPMFLYGFARFVRRAVLLTLALFVVPTAAFLVFWGANTTGALQEGLHAIFLFALVAAFVGHTALPHSRAIGRWVQVSASARVLEIIFVVMVPTLATMGLMSATFRVTDVLAVVLVIASTAALAVVSWRAFAPERIASVATPAAAPG